MAIVNVITRREFLSLSALAGGSLFFTNSMNLFAGASPATNIHSRGYVTIDASGKPVPWKY